MTNKKNLTDNINFAKQYSAEVYAKTKKYQKIYGFKIGSGSHDTWNNEADAFKHAFGSADTALKLSDGLSKKYGDKHESDVKNNPKNEENMDRWNNAIGRELAREIRAQYNPIQVIYLINTGQMDDIIAEKVMQKMRKGDLITNPFKDKRSYQKKINGSPTGYAADIPKGKIFTAEEIGIMSPDEFSKNEPAINAQLEGIGVPKEYEANEAVQNGSMIWVNPYKRDDGTEVKGYYRAR